jgi:signal transduction histidine kinase
MGDESELREVLVNMVFNAVAAMPHGGNLTSMAEDVDELVVISVGDTGTGMAPELSRVFLILSLPPRARPEWAWAWR